MEEKKKSGKRKLLTERDILERMSEIWEKLRFNRKLTKQEENVIDYNFSLIQLYCNLKPEDGKTTFACGFDIDEYEEEDKEGEEEYDSGKDR